MKMKGIIAAVAVAVCCAADAATAPNSTASAATSLQSGTFGAGVVMNGAPLVARFKTWGAALGLLVSDKWSELSIIIR